MNSDSFFKEGEHEIVQVGRNFKGWFAGMSVDGPEKKPYAATLEEYLSTEDITQTLRPAEVTLSVVARLLENKNDLIRDRFNIFFVRDAEDVLRIVDVYWSGLGWCVCARALDDTRRCVVGKVFSGKKFESIKPKIVYENSI